MSENIVIVDRKATAKDETRVQPLQTDGVSVTAFPFGYDVTANNH